LRAIVKQHDDEFENEVVLRSWLDEAGIEYTEQSLAWALGQLESAGRLKRPRQDQWNENVPL
jgi:hypothetical protein